MWGPNLKCAKRMGPHAPIELSADWRDPAWIRTRAVQGRAESRTFAMRSSSGRPLGTSRHCENSDDALHSPTTVTTTVRWRPRTSHSRWKICCQVPSMSLPPAMGAVTDGPRSVACRCECPFPSCHACSCP